MRRINPPGCSILAILILLFTGTALADGTVSGAPAVSPLASYEYQSICQNLNAGPANVTITVQWLRADGSSAGTSSIVITGATELRQYMAAVRTPAPGEPTAATLGAEAKRIRMRHDAYLIPAGLLVFEGAAVTVTPEN